MDSFKKYTSQGDFNDISLKLSIEDVIGRDWYDKDQSFYKQIDFLKRKDVLNSKTKVLHLGAHQGVVSLVMANQVLPNGLVLATEASERDFLISLKNIKLNRCDNLNVLNLSHSEDISEKKKAPFADIDSLVKGHFIPDFIYVDLEGLEGKVLDRGLRALKLCPAWLIEIHGSEVIEGMGGNIESLLDHFPEGRFNMFCSTGESNFSAVKRENLRLKERFTLVALRK